MSKGEGFFGDMGSWGGSCPCIDLEALEDDEARARLAAAAPEMARLLLEAEWSAQLCGYDASCMGCPWCWTEKPRHDPDCRLVACLEKAGIRARE